MALKKYFLLACATLFALGVNAQTDEETTNEWGDIGIFEKKKVYSRTNVLPYAKDDDVERLAYYGSDYYLDLGGKWKYLVTKDADERPTEKNFNDRKHFSTKDWETITIPEEWSKTWAGVQGLILKKPLPIPETHNAVVTYYKSVYVPKGWKNRDIFIHFESAGSAYYVWANGKMVGYAEDSYTPSEFNLTNFVKPDDDNDIIVQVFSTSTGSLLEMTAPKYRLGITGEVYMYSKAEANVSDYTVIADYSPKTKNGNINISATIENKSKKGEFYVDAVLWGPDGKEVAKYGQWVIFDKKNAIDIVFDREVLDVKPWSSETPDLYTLILRVRDKKLQIIETTGTRFGFRHLEMKNGKLQLNGNTIKLRGVVWTDYGKSYKERQNAFKMMRANNINAVLTTYHTPQPVDFYELADEYGIYVVDEANLQPFSSLAKSIATDLDYSAAFVARVRNMYERDKNHPSVIAWSLGNSADNGVCMENAYRFLKNKDKIRPVIYSGADFAENTDIVAKRGCSMEFLKQFVSKKQSRPLLLMEYGSTQGNSFGGLGELWDNAMKNREVMGGFAAYWNSTEIFDQATGQHVKLEGLVTDDGKATPALNELRQMYCPIKIKLVSMEGGEFSATNTADCLELKDFSVNYTIFSNIKPLVVSGDVNMSLKPGETKNFKLMLPKITGYAGEEFFIRFTVKQREKKNYIDKGTELGFSEIQIDMKQMDRTPLSFYERKRLYLTNLSDTTPAAPQPKNKKAAKNAKKPANAPLVEMENVKGMLQVFNEDMEVLFDADKVEITSMKINDKEILVSAPKLNFWRTPTVNDRADENAFKAWQSVGLDRLSTVVKGVNCRQDDTNRVTIDALYGIQNGSGEELFDVVQTYLIYCTGDVIINNQVLVSDAVKTMPRVGMSFAVNGDINKVEWFGREKESYKDRLSGSKMGVFSSPISAMTPKYNLPQASGNRTDTRWVSLESDNVSLFVDMLDTLFDFSLQKYTDEQMAHAKSYQSLKENAFTVVNVDYRHTGVGSGNGVDSKYLINGKRYSFVVRLKAFELEDESPSGIRMVAMPKVQTKVLPMPTISKDLDNFDAPMTITLASERKDVEIRYTLDGTEPNEKSTLYKKPFVIDNTTVVKAKAFGKDFSPSFTCKKVFNYNYVSSIEYTNQPNTPYNKNLEAALFDGVYGSTSNLSDDWLGFSGSNFEAVLTLVKPIDIQSVEATFMHAPESWAFAPKAFSVYVSSDGKTYSPEIKADVKFMANEKENAYNQVVTFRSLVNINQVKYIKVVATSIGKIPSWHEAKGLRPWLFIDEITINENVKQAE